MRAHHERIDGRGYPNGLPAEEIPEIAKIISVAEVYDTLTADDTYRTRMSSFEALTELRRVSGSQLDGRYVEALSSLLAGRGTEYRHADEADFDRELDVERRINEAVDRAPLLETDPGGHAKPGEHRHRRDQLGGSASPRNTTAPRRRIAVALSCYGSLAGCASSSGAASGRLPGSAAARASGRRNRSGRR